MSDALINEYRHNYKTRIANDIKNYGTFQLDLKKAEKETGMGAEQNMWLLVRKYEEAMIQRYKIQAYIEFLFL